MGSINALRHLYGLPVPQRSGDVFQSIQRTLFDFRKEIIESAKLEDPRERYEDELELLGVGETLMSGIRFKIFFLIRNSTIPPQGIYDLVHLYNRVWDRLSLLQNRTKEQRFFVSDIRLVNDDVMRLKEGVDPYEEEGIEHLPLAF